MSHEEITAEDVLGSLLFRIRNRETIQPRILCMSAELREENRALARMTIEQVKREEKAAAEMRAAGNPLAFFTEPIRK